MIPADITHPVPLRDATDGRRRAIHWLGVVGGIYFAGMLLVVVVPGSILWLAAVPGRSTHPIYWYSFLTFPVVHSGALHWIEVTALTAPSLLVLVPRLSARDLIVVMIASAVLGGVTYSVLADTPQPLIGGGTVAWGLAGAVVGTWARQRRTFGALAYVYACAMALLILGTLLFGEGAMDRGMLLASLASAAYAAWRAPSVRSVSAFGRPARLE